LTGVERHLDEDEFIVSKTDLKGRITYVNRVFMRISDYMESELLGKQHNIIRHPDMPRGVFHFLWERIQAQKEIFAYVLNLAKNGDHYWVLAHVTPSYDPAQNHVGYHSNRRKPPPDHIAAITPLYEAMLGIERRAPDPRQGLADSRAYLSDFLEQKGMSYDELVFAL